MKEILPVLLMGQKSWVAFPCFYQVMDVIQAVIRCPWTEGNQKHPVTGFVIGIQETHLADLIDFSSAAFSEVVQAHRAPESLAEGNRKKNASKGE